MCVRNWSKIMSYAIWKLIGSVSGVWLKISGSPSVCWHMPFQDHAVAIAKVIRVTGGLHVERHVELFHGPATYCLRMGNTNRPCRLGCGHQEDSLAHYAHCPVPVQAFSPMVGQNAPVWPIHHGYRAMACLHAFLSETSSYVAMALLDATISTITHGLHDEMNTEFAARLLRARVIRLLQ